MSELAPETSEEGPSAGSQLRQAREAAGLHVAALAVALKVPVGKLEALEADRYDLLPDAVFVRALASSVCRTLKIDPQPVLDRLPRGAAPRLAHVRDGLNAPFRVPGEGPRAGWYEQLTRPVTLAVGGLLLGALVLMLMPAVSELLDAFRAEPDPPAGAAAPVSMAPAEKPAQTPQVASPAAQPAPTAPTAPTSPVTAAPPEASAAPEPLARPAPVPAEVATVTAPAAAPAAAASAPGTGAPSVGASAAGPVANAAAPSGLVVFRTKGPSWVEVVDARGQTVMRRLMEGGEAASATGTVPLMVTVGSVGATEVQVRGRPFDLGPVSRDNVARFEVK
jgi:cytoskeleton protein RodZ